MAYSNHLFSTHAHTVNIYWNIQSTTIANYYITATGADFCCSKSGWRPWRKQINKTKNENWAVSFVFKWPQSLLELDQSCSRPDAAGRLWVTCGQLSLYHVYEHVELKPPRSHFTLLLLFLPFTWHNCDFWMHLNIPCSFEAGTPTS